MSVLGFQKGQIYNRRRDIHEVYGGQQQGGISTPKSEPVVILFTGSAGSQHGYADGWGDDGTFHYFGEGREGAMRFANGNKAIRDHLSCGKDLLLFEKVSRDGSVRFMGTFCHAGYDVREGPDRSGNIRRSIVFHLIHAEELVEGPDIEGSVDTDYRTLEELRALAYGSAGSLGETPKGQAKVNVYRRSSAVRQYARARAQGGCEQCGSEAPFLTSSQTPYLEVHHILRLGDGGPDHPSSVAAICPHCHRAAHHSIDKKALNSDLLARVRKLEEAYQIESA